MIFTPHQDRSITLFPAKGQYCGLVIDEAVRDDANDWKLYIPLAESISGDAELSYPDGSKFPLEPPWADKAKDSVMSFKPFMVKVWRWVK